MDRTYLCIDLKSFYASVECVTRGLDPLTTNLVVADVGRTEKTICLAVTPSLKAYGIPGRARLFEVIQKVEQINRQRKYNAPHHKLDCESYNAVELERNPSLALSYIAAPPRMAYYMEYSTRIYNIYLKYIAPEDIHVYSIDEVFIDLTHYLSTYKCTARELAQMMIKDVLATTGITATAGIGTNMYLAKIAMDITAKKMPADENGVRIAELDEMSYRKELWTHKPLTDFWMLGSGIAKKLEANYMYTMGDVARCSHYDEAKLFKLFGVNKAENKTLIPIPEEAEIVIRIFREYIGGKGIGKIVADLNKDSVPGKPWVKERVRYILTNEKYCGDSLYQKYYTPPVLPLRNIPNRGEVPKYYVEGTHVAIIDKETFHTVKQMFERNMLIYAKRQKREIENFAGRLICGDCGWVYKKRIVGSEPTWICSKNGVAGQRCKTHPLSEGALKKSFVFMYNRLQQHRELIIKDAYQKLLELRKAFFNSSSAVLDIDTELAELAEQNAMYVRFHSQKIIDEITFIEQTGEIKQRINELRSRRIKLMNDNEEERCVELLREAIQELEELPQSILLFDFSIFDKLVNKVAVMPDSLVFELRCGIKLREEIIWN